MIPVEKMAKVEVSIKIFPNIHYAFNRHHDRFGVNHRRLASKIPTFAGIFHQSQSLYVQIETKQRRSQGDEDIQ